MHLPQGNFVRGQFVSPTDYGLREPQCGVLVLTCVECLTMNELVHVVGTQQARPTGAFPQNFPNQRWRTIALFSFGLRSYQEGGSGLQRPSSLPYGASLSTMRLGKWEGEKVLPERRPGSVPPRP